MKTKLVVLSLFVIATVWTGSIMFAYHGGYYRGYQQGGKEERDCWTIDPAASQAWIHGEITARRDTMKHPFLRSRVVVNPVRSANQLTY